MADYTIAKRLLQKTNLPKELEVLPLSHWLTYLKSEYQYLCHLRDMEELTLSNVEVLFYILHKSKAYKGREIEKILGIKQPTGARYRKLGKMLLNRLPVTEEKG